MCVGGKYSLINTAAASAVQPQLQASDLSFAPPGKKPRVSACGDWQWSVCVANEGDCGLGTREGTRTGTDCKQTIKTQRCKIPCNWKKKFGGKTPEWFPPALSFEQTMAPTFTMLTSAQRLIRGAIVMENGGIITPLCQPHPPVRPVKQELLSGVRNRPQEITALLPASGDYSRRSLGWASRSDVPLAFTLRERGEDAN